MGPCGRNECWFLGRGENRSTRRKTSRSRKENQQTQPTWDAGSENRTRVTLVGGECSHHYGFPSPIPLFSIVLHPVEVVQLNSFIRHLLKTQGHPTTSFGRYLYGGGQFALGFWRRSKSALGFSNYGCVIHRKKIQLAMFLLSTLNFA